MRTRERTHRRSTRGLEPPVASMALRKGLYRLSSELATVFEPVSGGQEALDPFSVAARRLAAVLREGARERVLGGVADEVGDAAHRLLALTEKPRGELHPTPEAIDKRSRRDPDGAGDLDGRKGAGVDQR
jgi:hypothetical protein